MVERPAVVFAPRGDGIQPLSRHRMVPGNEKIEKILKYKAYITKT